jgi:U4/U6 small nuclear ribonucleoprotein PRP3
LQLIPVTTTTACQRRRVGGGTRGFFFFRFVIRHSSFVVRAADADRRTARDVVFFFVTPPRTRLTPTPNPRNIQPRGVQFVEEGTFQKQADMTRLRAKYGAAEARAILSREAAETADANSVPLGEGAAGAADDARRRALSKRFLPSLPAAGAAEWWDAALLADGASYGADVLREKITLYVEHPVPLAPPAGAEAPAPAPQPLKLTKAEQKKLRTQRRVAREQEKQEMIRQGLLEPPKPKVKISNLMRVLTDTAAADPTAIEKEVRAQMAERAEAHEDRNLARALTPAERKEKKLRKMFEETGGGTGETHVRVYRIESLRNPKHKFRVDINAQENRLTGAFNSLLFAFAARFRLFREARRAAVCDP